MGCFDILAANLNSTERKSVRQITPWEEIMSWIPGWDSVAGTGWWSGFFFWCSIGALIGLGIAEVASHRYSERKDELTAIEQNAIQRRHDEDMARVEHDTARANERAAQLEKEAAEAKAAIARANADAAAANAEAAKARTEQERLKAQLAWRTLTPELVEALEKSLAQRPGKVNVQHVANDTEALYLAIQFAKIFEKAKWQVTMLSVTVGGAIFFGLFVPDSPSADTATVREALRAANIGFATDALPGNTMGYGSIIPDAPVLFVGSKPIQQ
jgi:hypothetical protein